MDADLVLFNGILHTLNAATVSQTTTVSQTASAHSRPSALAARDGVIVYVGDDATALSLLRPGGEAINLGGACVLPGLADAHMHLQLYSLGLRAVQAETDTLDRVLQRVAERAAVTPPGAWITGHGWNHNAWGGAFPNRELLDRVAPQNPVYLEAKSAHAAWVNSRALELARIDAHTPDPAGGQIVRDAAGQPTGILLEGSAERLVADLIPAPTFEELLAALRAGLDTAARAGLTALHDMDGPQALAVEQELYRRGELPLRVLKSVPLEQLDAAIGLGLRSGRCLRRGLGDDWLRLGQVKLFADGALGPRTALMLAGYEDAPQDTGIAILSAEELCHHVARANAAGLACAVHAIGDRAVRQTLDAYAAAPRAALALPNRIEHVQLLHPDDLPRLARLGVVASMQPIHATSDRRMAERHWGARTAHAYAWRSVLDQGTTLALGSDSPVETISPLAGLHAAVTRRDASGEPGPQGWHPEQRLTLVQALHGYTRGAALAAGLETRLGALEPGYLADVTVLAQDILAIDPMELLQVEVLGTLVGGRWAWRAASLS